MRLHPKYIFESTIKTRLLYQQNLFGAYISAFDMTPMCHFCPGGVNDEVMTSSLTVVSPNQFLNGSPFPDVKKVRTKLKVAL